MNLKDTVALMREIGAIGKFASLQGTGWSAVTMVRAAMQRPPTRAVWTNDPWKSNPPDFNKEATCNQCVDWYLVVPKEGEPTLEIEFFNGDAVNGARTDLRCWWTWELTDSDDKLVHALTDKALQEKLKCKAAADRMEEERQRLYDDMQARIGQFMLNAGVIPTASQSKL